MDENNNTQNEQNPGDIINTANQNNAEQMHQSNAQQQNPAPNPGTKPITDKGFKPNINIISAIIIAVIIIAVIFIILGQHAPKPITTTIIPKNTITTTANIIATTTIPPNAVTSTTTTTTSTTTTIPVITFQSCNSFSVSTNKLNATLEQNCTWKGGILSIWGASGNSSNLNIELVANNKTYFNKNYSNNCLDYLANVSLPANNYNIIMKTGAKNGTCGNSLLELNTSGIPVYSNVYNGNFLKQYSGWYLSGNGFGRAPLNITYANNNLCYLGTPWNNYNASFFATTFNCGLLTTFGNISSSYFKVTKPFLNFKIISPQNQKIYLEILYNNRPYIVIHYNTFNNSLGPDASSTFRNATIPLETVLNKDVQIKVVAETLNKQTYIAIGNFELSNLPNQQIGIISNETINSSVIKS